MPPPGPQVIETGISELWCLFDTGSTRITTFEQEYDAFSQLGPNTKRVLGEECITKWSSEDICRMIRERKLDAIKHDLRIAAMILKEDRAAHGNRGHNGYFE